MNNRVEEIYKRGLESLESFYREKTPTGKKKKPEKEAPPPEEHKEYDTVNEQEV